MEPMTKHGILLIIGGTMNRDELKEYIGTTAFSLGHVEKDYFQHIILSGFSRRLSSSLVFKGGTALQKTGIIQPVKIWILLNEKMFPFSSLQTSQ